MHLQGFPSTRFGPSFSPKPLLTKLRAIETVLPPRHKLQQLEIIGSIGAHPGKVHAPKDIETFKGLLAELGAGWRGGVMEGAWLDNPRRLHRID
jgi:hypothetical protein